jgi:flagellar motor component MotA
MSKKMISSMAVSALSMAGVVFLAGGAAGFSYLVDIPSLLIAVILPFVTTLISFGPAYISRSLGCVFSADDNRDDLNQARAYFKSLLRSVGTFTLFAVVTGSVMLLANIADTTAIGRNLAVALLSLFYGTAAVMIFVLPCIAEIDRRLAQQR